MRQPSLGLGPGGLGVRRAGGRGAAPQERPGARGPQWRGPSSRARAPWPPPPRSCAWAGRTGPGVPVSVREERAGGVRAQPPTREDMEDRTASFKLKPCLRFMAGCRPLPHPEGSSPSRGGRLGPLRLFPYGAFGAGVWESPLVTRPLWAWRVARAWRRLGPGGSCAAPPTVVSYGGWAPAPGRAGRLRDPLAAHPLFAPSHSRRKQALVLALQSPGGGLGPSLGCLYTPLVFFFSITWDASNLKQFISLQR